MPDKITIENREELIFLLSQAAELEHGLLCSYLFASFSLKNEEAEGLTAEEAAAAAVWKRSIRKIAEQEMLHLTLANNLLTAIGAAPHFSRPNLPQHSNYYPADIQLALTPFSEQTLDHFIFIERPHQVKVKDGAGFSSRATPLPQPPLPAPAKESIVPAEQEYSTVDQLYQSIKVGLQQLVKKYGEHKIFIGPDAAQTGEQYFEFPGLITVTGLATAEEAIDLIVSQGEGSQDEYEESHFGIFCGIKEEYTRLKAQRPDFEPARPVLANPYARPAPDIAKYNLLDEPYTLQVSNLFNAAYEVMTQLLIRFFAHTDETRPQLKLLIKTAVDLMKSVIKPLGELLTKLPAGPGYPGLTAGPNFQFYRSIHLLPHKRAAWLIFHERLLEIAEYCQQLSSPELHREEIAAVEQHLREMAGQLQSQLES